MGRCLDCRWWGPSRAAPTVHGRCRAASNDPLREEESPMGRHISKALVQSDDLRAYLQTMADFGCVQFEANDATT